ncbi:hypothetical protein Q5P01_004394 [Channa striata]|uniref:Interleukin 17 receptor C n=1 Tax=Channa striata TaxID=64152 RepID=A0AA88NHM1_CHASR|nr:hypothetical protein Q5P01_004394 [Channa striata]
MWTRKFSVREQGTVLRLHHKEGGRLLVAAVSLQTHLWTETHTSAWIRSKKDDRLCTLTPAPRGPSVSTSKNAVGHSCLEEVICSQGLSLCTMKDVMSLPVRDNEAVEVQKLTPHFRLCCEDKASCTLCLVIDAEVYINVDEDMEDEGSGPSEDNSTAASVTVCYKTPSTLPTCKKVEFVVNEATVPQQKMSVVITEPQEVSFSSRVIVYPAQSLNLTRQIVAPSLNEVCVQEEQRVEECGNLPTLSHVVFQQSSWVELHFTGRNKSLVSLCVQNERSGTCQMWNSATIPLSAVTPCMCLQVWDKDRSSTRLSICPFKDQGSAVDVSIRNFIQGNVWHNVSVSVGHGRMNDYSPMLGWNLSAPCRLEGEAWPCHRESSCREVQGYRQQLENGTWTQNSKGLWETKGVFEDINLQLSPCVMVQVKGMEHELGPFCLRHTDRWRWSLLLVAVMLLVCFTVLVLYFPNDFLKRAKSCFHGGFMKIIRRGHVVLLSPPDADDGLSESICQLASLLRNQGFSVSVDRCSRKQQWTLGPLPWLHSQLMELDRLGGRAVLVLSQTALLGGQVEWTYELPSDTGLSQMKSPYADMFTACLGIIQAEKQLGRASERFVLVKFESGPRGDRRLPELLQGLPLFKLPSQHQALLSELSGRGQVSGLRGRTLGVSDAWRTTTAAGPDQQKASQYL